MMRMHIALVLALVSGLATAAAQATAATPATPSTTPPSAAAPDAHANALAAARTHFKAGEFDQAFTRVIALADAGDAQALHLVGRVHLQPAYANFDPYEAARLLQIAADKGYAPAQHDLAELLRRGLGLPRDALLAFRWHLSAAEQHYRLSELAIADMYARGEGVAINQQQASVWRARARRDRKPAASSRAVARAAALPPAKTTVPLNAGARGTPDREPSSAGGARAGRQPGDAQRYGHHIQLGAYGTAAAAGRQRELLLKQLRRISPNVRLGITSVDRGDGRGVLHRLRTQDMELGSARFLCDKLKKLLPQRGCFIVSGEP